MHVYFVAHKLTNLYKYHDENYILWYSSFFFRKFGVSLSEDDDKQFTCVDVYFYISAHVQSCYWWFMALRSYDQGLGTAVILFIYLFSNKVAKFIRLKKSRHLTSSHSTTAHDAFDSATDSGNGQTVELRRAVFKCTVSVGGAQGWAQRIGSRFCFWWCQHVTVWMQSAYQRSHCSMLSSFLLKPWFKLAALQRAES